ncbi:MAG TPA: ATP-binding cassette domain-containing protein, partial [Pirellulales bacterium]|nr:ATP-binding cassette domain-containing protein [Pirellulales bacterium]
SAFLRPDTGSVTLEGRDLTRLTPSTVAVLGVTRTFQQATPLAGLTVYQNVLVGMHRQFESGLGSIFLARRAVAREAQRLAGWANDLLETFGLRQLAEIDAKLLSFGQLRFLEIARAVATRPKFLLLDEPAAGLNEAERDQLAIHISRFRKEGIGVLLVDHDVPFVFGLCDHMTVINFGSVIATGDPASVGRDPVVREAYLGNDSLENGDHAL